MASVRPGQIIKSVPYTVLAQQVRTQLLIWRFVLQVVTGWEAAAVAQTVNFRPWSTSCTKNKWHDMCNTMVVFFVSLFFLVTGVFISAVGYNSLQSLFSTSCWMRLHVQTLSFTLTCSINTVMNIRSPASGWYPLLREEGVAQRDTPPLLPCVQTQNEISLLVFVCFFCDF